MNNILKGILSEMIQKYTTLTTIISKQDDKDKKNKVNKKDTFYIESKCESVPFPNKKDTFYLETKKR